VKPAAGAARQRRPPLILTGIAGNVCILSGANDACMRGYNPARSRRFAVRPSDLA
jgi:hypothetical protein